MKTTITTWGNSLAVRIPKPFALQIGIVNGAEVEMSLKNDALLLKKSQPSLAALLKRITQENIHGEDAYDPVGKEIW